MTIIAKPAAPREGCIIGGGENDEYKNRWRGWGGDARKKRAQPSRRENARHTEGSARSAIHAGMRTRRSARAGTGRALRARGGPPPPPPPASRPAASSCARAGTGKSGRSRAAARRGRAGRKRSKSDFWKGEGARQGSWVATSVCFESESALCEGSRLGGRRSRRRRVNREIQASSTFQARKGEEVDRRRPVGESVLIVESRPSGLFRLGPGSEMASAVATQRSPSALAVHSGHVSEIGGNGFLAGS